MAIDIRPTGCCGMEEINNLGTVTDPLTAIKQVCRASRKIDFTKDPKTKGPNAVRPTPILVFSGVTKRVAGDHSSSRPDNYAAAFAGFILDQGFGSLVKGAEVLNPKTRNLITAWIWNVDIPVLDKWYDEELEKEREEAAKVAEQKAKEAPPTPPTPSPTTPTSLPPYPYAGTYLGIERSNSSMGRQGGLSSNRWFVSIESVRSMGPREMDAFLNQVRSEGYELDYDRSRNGYVRRRLGGELSPSSPF